MKIEANLLTVIKGQIKEIEIFGDVYELIKKDAGEEKHDLSKIEVKPIVTTQSQPHLQEEPFVSTGCITKEKETKPYIEPKDKGEKIDNVYNSVIYKNIYDEIEPFVLSENDDTDVLKEIIKKYYPNSTETTWNCLPSTYRNYIKRKNGIKIPNYSVSRKKTKPTRFDNVKIDTFILTELVEAIKKGYSRLYLEDIMRKHHPKVKKETIQKYLNTYLKYINIKEGVDTSKFFLSIRRTKKKGRGVRKPSSDCVGFSKKYKTWIRAEELAHVKRGVRTVKYGFIPTVENIANEINKSEQRVRASLDYLITRGLAERKLDDSGNFVYRLVE